MISIWHWLYRKHRFRFEKKYNCVWVEVWQSSWPWWTMDFLFMTWTYTSGHDQDWHIRTHSDNELDDSKLPCHYRTSAYHAWLYSIKGQSTLKIKTNWLDLSDMDTSVRTRQNFQARALGDFHGRVSNTARAWGHKFSSEAMHVYMGENKFSICSYHIGTVFKSIQLSFDIYRVSNDHLV